MEDENQTPQTRVDRDEFEAYCLFNQAERVSLLKRLVKTPCTLHVILGARAYLALPLGIDGNAFFIEAPQDLALRSRFTNARQVLVQTELDKIAVEFRLDQLFSATYDGVAAFKAEIPDKILRLQRRETFRINTQGVNTAFCKFTHKEKPFNFAVLNLSIGGMALGAPMSGNDFAVNDTVENAELFLPQTPPLKVSFQIRSVQEEVVGVRKKLKLGCLFLDLKGPTEVQISRCITQLERSVLRTGG